ncbi:MAG: hypothetical protein ABEI75_01845 [Halobaculum sp.]
MVSESTHRRGTERAYDDWACPACETLNDGERTECRECEFTTEPDEGRSRAARWGTAAALGIVGIVGGLTVLVVGVQHLAPELVPLPVLAGIGLGTVGMNLAVDSLDW